MTSSEKSYWQDVCAHWKHLGAPLSPDIQDTKIIKEFILKYHSNPQQIKLLIFGVTPELINMDWPFTTTITAVEKSPKMIDTLWEEGQNKQVVCGNWLEYTSCDKWNLSLGDGVHCSLNPDEQKQLFAKAYELIEDNGISIFRFFVLHENLDRDSLFEQLQSGQISSFHSFKIRLAMSLQETPQQGIQVSKVFECWKRANIDVEELMNKTGWSKETINTISFYKGKDTVYYFTTLDGLLSLAQNYFVVEDIQTPNYPSGEVFPTVVFKKKK